MQRKLFGILGAFALGMMVGRMLDAGSGGSGTILAAQNRAMAGIEKLHQLDQRVTLVNDPAALQEEWTADAVRLQPDGPADVGKAAIYATDVRSMAAAPGSTVVSYKPDIRDVRIVKDWAIEWGYFEAGFRESASKPVMNVHGKMLRVMHRENSGDWKFARVMVSWNTPQSEKQP